MTTKPPDTVCIYLQNAGGILPTNWGQLKLDKMKMLTHTNQIGICTMTKINANGNKIAQDLHPWHSTRGWWECVHWNTICNWNKKHQQEYQPGRVAISILNKTAHQAMQSGYDKSGLGRWCWVKLKGK